MHQKQTTWRGAVLSTMFNADNPMWIGSVIPARQSGISHLSSSHSLVGGHHSCFHSDHVGTDGWLGVWVASLSPDIVFYSIKWKVSLLDDWFAWLVKVWKRGVAMIIASFQATVWITNFPESRVIKKETMHGMKWLTISKKNQFSGQTKPHFSPVKTSFDRKLTIKNIASTNCCEQLEPANSEVPQLSQKHKLMIH